MNRYFRVISLFVIAAGLIMLEWRPWHNVSNTNKSEMHGDQANFAQSPAASQPNAVSPELGTKFQRTESTIVSSDKALPVTQIPVIRAQLSPVNFTTITAEISAKVESLVFREGESFNLNSILVTFDCSVQLAQLEKVRAAMGIAERNYNTNKRLLALGSVSRVETENAHSEYLKSRAEVAELSAIVSKCKISAPFNGRVVEQRVRVQQFAQSGQPLLDILDDSALELEFVAPSKWSTWIKTDYRFKIRIDEAGKSYPAKVTRISPRIDPVSQTIKIAAVIDGEFPELTPGMSGSIEILPPESLR
ncbi:efflux RND transporter periplasmic adaptor subunit [Orrella sp. NBD-18]|uniref:Efflux RND transporter periplasmic adaptor subunit n=1 Tax=Sheuella amnicola TaxID=2707330 RepID=A0A6B2R1Q5_9BURK|nr:efflux RND transporter periplasmic adaptor subunit [Sheuella amnicola]NDY84028.1 efflux RND transporter periplasmic adaptor subunit [Sheuella amnicola]HBI83268.1 efflux transporter periplasmic adaptor subunit [Alcaligenaceae bacterium]